MATLKPLLDNVDVKEYKGRFDVQLEVPPSSTLSTADIDKIGYLASWTVDPNNYTEEFEGLRSILINREKTIEKKRLQLEALQISGIGSKGVEFREGMAIDTDEIFQPPSNANFIDLVPGTLMTTSYAEKGKLAHSKPKYRAYGTYTSDELKTKLIRTNTASGFDLEEMVIPYVEAYGRYLDDNLQNQEGPFGFIVFPVPSANQQRVTGQIIKSFDKFMSANAGRMLSLPQVSMTFYTIASAYFSSIIHASRELHDKARHAHLQLHLSNVYLANKMIYVMDWSTLTKLGPDRENNIINRTIDLLRPQQDFMKLFSIEFSRYYSQEATDLLSVSMRELSMEVYSGNRSKEVNAIAELINAEDVLGRPANDFEVVVQWMKDQGIEGFPKYEERPKKPPARSTQLTKVSEVGRNEPCPCGSGKKYKKCCIGKI